MSYSISYLFALTAF